MVNKFVSITLITRTIKMTTEEYELQKQKDFENVKEKFESAFSELKKYNEEWAEWNVQDENFEMKTLNRCLFEFGFKLNCFTYDDTSYNRCGDRTGNFSAIVTTLTLYEVKIKMKEYFQNCVKNSKSFCRHEFLSSISNFGIIYCGYCSSSFDFDGDALYHYSLNNINEKDIFSSEEYSEIIKKREDDVRKKREAEELLRKQRIEEAERKQYEELKKKYS